jgi:hypothetical protein
MPITPEQADALEAEDRYVRAQTHLYEWMERAQQSEQAADSIIQRPHDTVDWEAVTKAYRAEADRALVFAHAWAEAAIALRPMPLPLPLLTSDGE